MVANGRFVESHSMTGTNRRQYFTEAELGKLISAARKGRYGQRDATLILIMARHGRGRTRRVALRPPAHA